MFPHISLYGHELEKQNGEIQIRLRRHGSDAADACNGATADWLWRFLAGANRFDDEHHHAHGINLDAGHWSERDFDGQRFAFGGHRDDHLL
jgi:hypothetical protein